MKPILEIKNISKKYKLRGQESPYLTFRDALTSGFKKNKTKDEFWALQDVSFDVYPGESIGIIGRNGAGKSTLLKILSRITPTTTGEIISRGRIASLLEVGTGFHAELSGRENIFLNGSILGLTKKEITKQFDAIVDFSGVEKFLDTPLKHYSSGMQLRLAFAVAAHLEPEILIIDEVLAVGDAAFQQKCIGKMDEVSKSGRTILFVSHNLSQVQTLCNKGILLEEGKQLMQGQIDEVINRYSLNSRISGENRNIDLSRLPRSGPKSESFNFTMFSIAENKLYENEMITMRFEYEAKKTITNLHIGFSISSLQNITLIENRSTATLKNLEVNEPGVFSINCTWKLNLKAGVYHINIGARSMDGLLEYIPSATILEVLPSKNRKELNEWDKPNNGLFLIDSIWKTE
ncbi:MAG: ABC transporter ATP-binding protein [Salinivirgaceae bacterium]